MYIYIYINIIIIIIIIMADVHYIVVHYYKCLM